MSVIDFAGLCQRLDPNYGWVRAMTRRGTRPIVLVGFSIGPVGEKWVVTFGDCPVALLHQEDGEWLVSKYEQETGKIVDLPRRNSEVGPLLSLLLDIMIEFQQKRAVALARKNVQASTRHLNEMVRNRQ